MVVIFIILCRCTLQLSMFMFLFYTSEEHVEISRDFKEMVVEPILKVRIH